MKIAHLLSTYLPEIGGAQICVHNIAERHVKQGHEVVVITPRKFKAIKTGNYKKEGLYLGTLFLLLKIFPLGKQLLLDRIRFLQNKYKFDIWQVTIGYPLGVAVFDYLKENGIPCILRSSGEDIQINKKVHYGIRLNPKADAQIRQNYIKADAVVSISNSMSKEYKDIGIEDEKINLIPNGVDCSRFLKSEDKILLRKKLGLPLDKKILLTVGRNHPKKGFDQIPNIIREISKKRTDFIWVIIGDGSDKIKDLATKDEQVDEYLIVLDSIKSSSKDFNYPSNDLIEYYFASDIFVFPTIIETFGIVIIEAMAAGLPIVTTNAPGADDVVEEGKTGFKVAVGDVNSMALRINELFENNALYQTIKNNVIAEAKKHDWNNISDAYMDLYKKWK